MKYKVKEQVGKSLYGKMFRAIRQEDSKEFTVKYVNDAKG